MRRTLCTIAAGLALALAACGDDDNGGNGESSKAGEPYPEDIRENFMNSCEESSNGKTAVCQCSLDKIEDQYSLDEFKKIDEQQREAGSTLPQQMQDIVEECVREES